MAKKLQLTEELVQKYAHKSASKVVHKIKGRILIVCEGEKTEPNYFKAFNKMDNGVFVVDLNFGGGGINTVKVVDEAIRLKAKAEKMNLPYDSVWAVFDRDSFQPKDFNDAIFRAESRGIECAWSNEAFELWYLLHFEYRNTGMSREEYKGKIEQHINASPFSRKKNYRYKKNDEKHFEEMMKYGNMDTAIANAKRLDALYDDTRYANHNPRTWVYKLVSQLMGQDKAFNEKVKEGI